MGIFESKTKMNKVTEQEGIDIYELGGQLYYFNRLCNYKPILASIRGGWAVHLGKVD
ncbi:hypothetical protein [Acidiphilium multivorum]|uniref:hypothetical protein n=1 Tax=Acidiphilium multivorum TaxID=62140 RepID=UPI001F4BE306|nr:hypothetical protein [Acidiphilium multivorum]